MARTTSRRLLSVLRITTMLSVLFSADPAFSQVSDDFSDGNFTYDPTWAGDTSDFIVSTSNAIPAGMQPGLQLQGQDTDSSFLSVPSDRVLETEWVFWIKLSFNTSANNFVRVYLASDQADLKNSLNGYFLQIGGATDSLVLFRQQGLALEPLLTGQHVFTGQSTNALRIRVRHDADGMWHLFADPAGGFSFMAEGVCYDETVSTAGYCGLYCRYTASNASKVYFDDLVVSELMVDTLPPQVSALEWLTTTKVQIEFSEPLDPLPALDPANYFLGPGIGPPDTVYFGEAPHILEAVFPAPLDDGTPCTLFIEYLEDLYGNGVGDLSIDFIFSAPVVVQPWDLLFNEVMADVNPVPAGLPAAEYLELLNRSAVPLSTQGLRLSTSPGSVPFSLPALVLDPGGFLIVTGQEYVEEFSTYGNAIGLPGFNLLREGVVELSDGAGRVIHRVEYHAELYGDDEQAAGGWSLEQIDPWKPCTGPANWKASTAPAGGTPGSANAVDADNDIPLRIEQVVVSDDSWLEVVLNTALFPGSLSALGCHIFPDAGAPLEVVAVDSSYRRYAIHFAQGFFAGIIYEFRLSEVLTNCTGGSTGIPDPYYFGMPEPAAPSDVIINELLFNPVGDGVDFVELYNRSAKTIDLQQLKLGRVETDLFGQTDTTFKSLTGRTVLLLPGEYRVLTTDPQNIMDTYFSHNPTQFIKLESMPAYNNDKGVVVLATAVGNVLDHLQYDEEMHHPLLITPEGVSLERLHYDRSSADPTNWHSASSASGYATPGLPNSQFSEEAPQAGFITVEPEVFSPDNDGFEDVTHIRYRLASPGYVATILLFDASGRPVRTLLNNELLGQEGTVSWDGLMDDRSKAPIGIYVLWFEAFEPNGHVLKLKKVVVVSGR